ncbi:hypothetical protein [Salinimonas chungwhensis]|uniref:hypothetical protein n=1 Tax=Salinimonas chungwhensis TaxID=265425 RepID=UPI0003647BF4|nr:hypothetical protein [Salinimonas chungwhensis]
MDYSTHTCKQFIAAWKIADSHLKDLQQHTIRTNLNKPPTVVLAAGLSAYGKAKRYNFLKYLWRNNRMDFSPSPAAGKQHSGPCSHCYWKISCRTNRKRIDHAIIRGGAFSSVLISVSCTAGSRKHWVKEAGLKLSGVLLCIAGCVTKKGFQ